MANNGRFDAGTRAILAELRDLRIEAREDRRRSDERFERMFHEFREDSARRDTRIEQMFKQVHTVGIAIVKTLNRHTRILENLSRNMEINTRILRSIDRRLGGRDNGRPGANGGRAS